MKALKTCKTGCGKMKSGGAVKKVKRMAMGGAMDKPQIYGIPQTGTTNYSAPTMKTGGMVKKQDGGPTPRKTKTVVTSPSGNYKTITKTKNNPDKGSSSASSKVKLTAKGVFSPSPGVKTAIKNRNSSEPNLRGNNPYGDFKKGGMVKKKLAALAAPTNKITRADVIAGALKNKRKKK
jgi:hypothetical protein